MDFANPILWAIRIQYNISMYCIPYLYRTDRSYMLKSSKLKQLLSWLSFGCQPLDGCIDDSLYWWTLLPKNCCSNPCITSSSSMDPCEILLQDIHKKHMEPKKTIKHCHTNLEKTQIWEAIRYRVHRSPCHEPGKRLSGPPK